jgi:hypothetical protein
MSKSDPIAELRNGFNGLSYPGIREHLPLLQRDVIAQADLVAFASTIPSQKWACIAGQNCPAPTESDRYVRAMSQTGVKYTCLAFPNGRSELWSLDTENHSGELDPHRIKSARIDEVVRHLIENAETYSPEHVIDQKFRSLATPNLSSKPWQLSFASAGLPDLQEEQTETSLVTLLNECTGYALEQWQNFDGCPDDAGTKIGRTFLRLVAARALVDKGIRSTDRSDMDACLKEARSLLPSFMDLGSIQVPQEILNTLWLRLQEVRFELLTGDMLAGIYERGLLSAKEQRQHGIHYTPPSLRRLLWNAVSEHLKGVAPSNLRILDPTCGSGGFLLTVYDGLVRMAGGSPHKSHDVALIRKCLMGVDQDPFACDIARLALILQSHPTSNAWMIQQSDFLQWTPYSGCEPNVILGNPPFQLGTDILLRSIQYLSPDGLIGMVMPKSFLSGVMDQSARDNIVENTDLIGVVEFPDKIFKHSQESTCAIIARRRSGHKSSQQSFDYLGLDRSILPNEQRRRFFIGDWSFTKLPVKLGLQCFAEGNLELADLWDSIQASLRITDIADFHQGIILRGKKSKKKNENPEVDNELPAVVADVSDCYRPGYLPFLNNARDCIDPFFIKSAKYVEWAPEKMYTPSKFERWQPNKVVIGRQVSHKQRWRLQGAVDCVGFAYDTRIIGFIPAHNGWSPYALLSFLTSSYANAWYSSRSQQVDIIIKTLRKMPVPHLSEDQLDHLSALGEAISRCAEISATKDLEDVIIGVCEYAIGMLLQEVDELVLNAFGFNPTQKKQIREFMDQAGKQRPGLPDTQLGGAPFVISQQSEDKPVPLYETTGIVLACIADKSQAILWLDGLELAVPLIISADILPSSLRISGVPVKARATLTAQKSVHLAVSDISPHPTARLSRSEVVSKMEKLLSRTQDTQNRFGDDNDA